MQITAVLGDLTSQHVDVVVTSTNRAARGGGGLDGAIHRAGGPEILADCVRRFPDGIAPGDAGWTTAGDLPARWVVHTVAPRRDAERPDRAGLAACYRRALEVARELGARSVALPVIGTGALGWPPAEAAGAAADAIEAALDAGDLDLDMLVLVTTDKAVHEHVSAALARRTPLRILQGVHELHRRGREHVRLMAGMSPSGFYWRAAVAAADNFVPGRLTTAVRPAEAISYTTGSGTSFAGGEVTLATTPAEVAGLLVAAVPALDVPHADPAYAAWFAGLLELVERDGKLPIAFADWFDDADGWEVGWGSGTRYPHPPAPATA